MKAGICALASTVLIVATFLISPAAFDLPAVSKVSHLQASQMRGGNPNWCMDTKYDCPDPNGLPGACEPDPITQECRRCFQTVATRSFCRMIPEENYACSQTSTGNTCGTKKKGGTPINGVCKGQQAHCALNDGPCGVAVFTTTGVPCP